MKLDVKNRLANWLLNTKAALGGISTRMGTDHAWTIESDEDITNEGYCANPTVFACVDLVATSFARIPFKVKDANGEPLPDSQFKKLINNPNPDENEVEFRKAQGSFRLLLGNSFTEYLASDGMPIELWNWQPYQMGIVERKNARLPAGYVYNKNNPDAKFWEVDQITGMSEMMHWRSFNPKKGKSNIGMPPLLAAAYATDSYNAAQKWRYNQAKNGGTLDGILSAKAPGNLNPEQRKELERKLSEKFTGADRAGRKLGVVSSEMTFTSIVTTLRDAEWLGGTKLNKQEICEVYKVATQLLGIEGSQTYANYEQAMLSLFYLAVLPLADEYVAEMNRWLGPFFPGETLYYDKADIPALEAERSELRRQKQESGAYSINEIRASFGDEPREEAEADAVLTDPSKIPLGMDVFSSLSTEAGDVAKSLMRAGMPRAEAESKALEWLYDRKD